MTDPPYVPRRRGRRAAASALVLAALVLGACAGDDDAAGGSAEASTGAELYEESCASCHGSDLRGTDAGPSHLSQVYAPDHHPDASFRAAITQGSRAHHWNFGDMPPVEGLDEEEIDQIIAYVREQQVLHGFEPYPPS
ncbi:c-type cytochrome [Actinomarinicola tropica]|uniref:C-type cytochrome n=1 Tax=Actinomarinicola tropica TaxID=2789776 RepID=A0A5Q2RIJ7_9ACTN|nr:cytochrome c [Actinomarinicola tropica]QGG94206.1 c-type cytochrome [Actinomarinicola tropica]